MLNPRKEEGKREDNNGKSDEGNKYLVVNQPEVMD